MLDLFIETAEKGALQSGTPPPTICWFTRGTPKFADLRILTQGLLAGQVLRVVAEERDIRPALEAFCRDHNLRIIAATEDITCTIFGCYIHVYVEITGLDSAMDNGI